MKNLALSNLKGTRTAVSCKDSKQASLVHKMIWGIKKSSMYGSNSGVDFLSSGVAQTDSYRNANYEIISAEDFIQQNTTKNMENIIGYKLKKEFEQYKEAAKKITGTTEYSDYSWEENFNKDGYFFRPLSDNKDKLQEAGVLDLWFEPVFPSPKFKAGDLVIVLDTKNVRSYTSNAIGHILKLSEQNIRNTEADRMFAEQGIQKYPVNYRKGDLRHATKAEIEEFNKPKVGDYVVVKNITSSGSSVLAFDVKVGDIFEVIETDSSDFPEANGKGWLLGSEGKQVLTTWCEKSTKEAYEAQQKSKQAILTLGTSNIRITIKGGKITADGKEFKLKSLKDTLGFFSSYNTAAYPSYKVRFKGSFRIGCSDFTKEDLELIIKTAESQLGIKNETTKKNVEDYPF